MAGQAPSQGPIPDLRPMEELLQAPTDGVGDAIVVPPILANQFELKIGLLNLVTAIAFHGFENDDPHSHIRRFTKITQTVKLNNIPSDVVKLLLFPFSLEGAAQTWLEKEPPNSITTWNDLVSKFMNRFFPPPKTTNLRNEITRFQQRFGETFAEPWDRFKDLLNKCPHHGFSPLHQIDTFYNSLNQSEQDSLNSAAGGNFLTKNTQEALTIIENKSKVQTSRNKPQVASASGSSTQDAHITSLTKQVAALLSLHRHVNSIQNGYETCGGPHPYYECQAAGGYTQDVYATSGTYNQGGNTYQPQGNRNLLSYGSNNYLGPPIFNQGNNQNQNNLGNNQGHNQGNYQNNQNINQNQNQTQNQNRYNQGSQNQGYNQNKGHNFNQGNIYNQNQGYNQNQAQPNMPSLEESIYQHMRSTKARIQQMQTQNNQQIQQMQNHNTQEIQQLKTQNVQIVDLMSQMQKVLHERPPGALPSNTEPNPREQVNFIMTRSGLTTAEPSFPPHIPPTPRVEVEKEPETLMDEMHITSPASTAHVLPPRVQPVSPPKEDPKSNPYQPKIPYPSRLIKIKLLDKNDVQVSKFLKILKQIHFDISLMDALTQILKFTKVLKDLLKDKEKLEELENTPINAECSAILFNKVPKKLDDPGKFLIPCILQDLEVYNSLADSRASINLMPLSICEKLGIGPLKPTRMTLELANRSVTFLMGIAEDVIVKVEKFNFLADFVIVDFEADPRVPIILGKPFLSTARALVDLYEEKLTLRVGNEEVVFYTDKSSRNNSRDIHSVNCINIINFSKDKTISGNPTSSSDFMIESLSAYPIPCRDSDHLLEETDTLLSHFDNSMPEYETFSFDTEEQSSGSTTTHYDNSLPVYEAFYFDDNHSEEKSSGSTTTHSDFSLPEYDSFIFDFSINMFPPTDRSAFYHEEFADELAHIISPPEYDYFYFDLEADLGEFTNVLEKNIFDLSTNDFTSIELNNSPLLLYDCDSSLSKEFSEIDLLVLFPSGNEDIVFDPGIIIIKGVQSQRFKIPLNFFYYLIRE
ncbi:reverse transcriptase domain-containing protein [Tanacetum coccineum]